MKPILKAVYYSSKTNEPFQVINMWQRGGEWTTIDIMEIGTAKIYSMDYSEFMQKFVPMPMIKVK